MAFSQIILFGAILVLLYLFTKWKYSYWQRKNIPFLPSKPPFGFISFPRSKKHLSLRLTDVYEQFKDHTQMVGLYLFVQPVLLLTNCDLVRTILIKDFQYFQDRSTFYNEKDDPLSAHLFNLDYERWRPLRSKLSPTFTSGKMKFMFPTIVQVCNEFIDCLKEMTRTDNEVEVNEILGRFTTDVIGSCAFGIECNSLKDPHAMFRQMGKKVFEKSKLNALQRTLVLLVPKLARLMGVRLHYKDVTDFFFNIVKKTVKYREENNIQRRDFMDLLIELKNSPWNSEKDGLTIEEIAAQAFVFFLAGFETSSTTLTYCLYELSLEKNRHIQDRAREEIESVLERFGELSYEALNEMTYIEQIINETLRKHPPAGITSRVATKPYKVPDTDYTIPKGMIVFVPIYGLQHDAEIYENPDEFIPERFAPEEIIKRPSCSFIPFGDGPRNCIGLRFGMLESRLALVRLLQNFEFSTCSRTLIPMQYSPTKLVLSPIDGMWLNIKQL